MAEDTQVENVESGEVNESSKGGSSLKTLIIIVVIMMLEGGAIIAFMQLAGGPADVKGDDLKQKENAEMDQPFEIEIVKDRFFSSKSGRDIYYDTEIFVVVKKKHSEDITAKIEGSKAQIVTDISAIVQNAEAMHLTEPAKTTLRRQIKAKLDERFGVDEDDEAYIQKVLIPKCNPIRLN